MAPWTVTLQASLPMEFSRHKYWSGVPFPADCTIVTMFRGTVQYICITVSPSPELFIFLSWGRNSLLPSLPQPIPSVSHLHEFGLFWVPHTNGITVFFCVWLRSLSSLSSVFLHLVTRVRVFFLVEAMFSSFVCADHTWLVCSSMDAWVAAVFWRLWIMLPWT